VLSRETASVHSSRDRSTRGAEVRTLAGDVVMLRMPGD